MLRSIMEWWNGPWRRPAKDKWNENLYKKLVEDVRTIKFGAGIERAGILFCGPVQSGKSSLVNSIFSISKERRTSVSQVTASERSVTLQYITAPDNSAFKNFEIRDTAGLAEAQGRGLNIQDLVYALNGNIKADYEFQGNNPIDESDPFFVHSPSKEDKSHCLVMVLDATLLDTITDRLCNKLRQALRETTSKGVPIVVILTKADKIYPYLLNDIKYLFHSGKVKKAVTMAGSILGIQRNNIHPVVNCVDDMEVDPVKCIPILLALKQILQFASDHIEFRAHFE